MIEVDLIKKHGKKALGLAEHPHGERTWRGRVGEILLEIGIIVFAISLSIWLHAWQEQRHDQAAEKEFLVSLRTDLQADLKELHEDSVSYVAQQKGFRYFLNASAPDFRPDSIKKHQWVLTNATSLIPNSSRYESMKSAGRLGIIEDKELLNDIVTNYQELIPSLITTTKGISQFKQEKIGDYLMNNLKHSGENFGAVMTTDKMKNYLNIEGAFSEILNRYHMVMQQNRKIIRKINKELAE